MTQESVHSLGPAIIVARFLNISHLAALRSWNSLYCVLKPGQLSAYKDAKSFGHGVTYHGEDPLSLASATWEVLTNYKKKKHVSKLR